MESESESGVGDGVGIGAEILDILEAGVEFGVCVVQNLEVGVGS